MRMRGSIPFALVYASLIIGFSFWWAANFLTYAHMKGDEYFFEIEVIIGFTYLSFIIYRLATGKPPWLFILSIPILVAVLSAMVYLFFCWIGLTKGTSNNDLSFYGIIYGFLTIFLVWKQFRKQRTLAH